MDYFNRTIISILTAGPIPQHISFIMDGNRRYARQRNQEAQMGHYAGFESLKKTLEVCLRLGVKCVSVYAFSIENFKRPPVEVNTLMGLAKTKLKDICQEGELLSQYSVRLNVIGRRELLPEDVQEAIRECEDLTRNNDKAILNILMPYTSRDEMLRAVDQTIDEHNEKDEFEAESDIANNLEMKQKGSPPLDMYIRTSGVKRFSDYLLWQLDENTQIYFTSVYWPDFGLWDFVPMLFDYQRKVWSGALGPRRQALAANAPPSTST
ncbi:dehydrodolichyl diphosphate synthetase [Clavulina sp. PMI_390]|nr:dehydrodolichyl diphosphate synthetase [Clavulina sp. PMI_390]